ncbi:hypothetical protein WAE58_07780 [Pedobacter panaciterrae]|jgi:hypothetical protein|uniref:Uncharacterized protein n=1 Tax=Pedobacter panaciterrae TaxID=363849 RepID=A0ABU8NLF4_9SPHI|nr:hypothetical protein [Pedobacter panaciterrae]NQX55950.1 hypothetical protein [Pedobacter panaciterrae]
MKYFLIGVLCFALMSALPLLWNHFSFVELGFLFPYLQKKTFEGVEGSSFMISFISLNLLYDLAIVAIFVWMLTYLKTATKNYS